MTYYDFVSTPRFFAFLLEIDRSIADEVHGFPCPICRGKLDRGDFWRSGHGFPSGSSEELQRRFSFCCRADGCRKRVTPESVRFLRGMSYVSVVIVLLSAINHGSTSALAAGLKVSRQTVRRWIKWWREVFVASPFWRERRGNFMPSLSEANLAQSLVVHFGCDQKNESSAFESLLRFLAPFVPN